MYISLMDNYKKFEKIPKFDTKSKIKSLFSNEKKPSNVHFLVKKKKTLEKFKDSSMQNNKSYDSFFNSRRFLNLVTKLYQKKPLNRKQKAVLAFASKKSYLYFAKQERLGNIIQKRLKNEAVKDHTDKDNSKQKLFLNKKQLLKKYLRKSIFKYSSKANLYTNKFQKKKLNTFPKKHKRSFLKKLQRTNLGMLHILFRRRNIFCTLSDQKGNMYSTVSIGLLKVKGRKRQALHNVKATGKLIIKKIFKHNIRKLVLSHKGKSYRKKKKTLLTTFAKIKQFIFLKIKRPGSRPHNGCRPAKVRRK